MGLKTRLSTSCAKRRKNPSKGHNVTQNKKETCLPNMAASKLAVITAKQYEGTKTHTCN